MQVSGKLITRGVEPYYGGDNEITYPYDAQGRVVTMLESNESSYSFVRNAQGDIISGNYINDDGSTPTWNHDYKDFLL